MYIMIALSFAVLGFFFPPLWILSAIFFAGSLLSFTKNTAGGIVDAIEKAKLMKCRMCRKEIARAAKICPHCGHEHL